MDRFDALQALVRVVETGSFSAAAERLRVAKSAVSRRITELEEHLGARLLHRTTRRLSLTDAGQQFYERAVRLLADMEEAEQAVSDRHAELRGRLRVAAPLSFGLQHLAPAVAEFLGAHPEVALDLDLNDSLVNLVEEGFDLGVRIGRLADSRLVARRLAPIRLVVGASPAYLARHGEPPTPEALADHQGLLYTNMPESQAWAFTDPDGRPRPVKVPVRLRANNGDVLLRAAIQGLGIVVTPSFIAWQAIEAGELVPILRDFPLPEDAAYAVYPSGRHQSRRARAFIDALAARFGDAPYWDRWAATGR